MRSALAALALLAAASILWRGTSADPAREVDLDPPRELRGGANHRLGDDSFIAKLGRAPTSDDAEEVRMHVHLEYVRDLLAARAPTAPVLAGRRAEILNYLGDYIAAGVTPKNTYVPWRSPVFIDAGGAICAVGYLIERSAGRALPERIAAAHRLAYLEEIAAAMPEVAAWIAGSGFTVAELASIQPGYQGPDVQFFRGWDLPEIENGPYHHEQEGASITGAFRRKQMTGTWKRTTDDGKLLGIGTFRGGAGTWKSLRLDGSKLAEGAFMNSHPEGEWRYFHPSGRLAAIGSLRRGQRHGRWMFFHDVKGSPRLSTGRFAGGETAGDWRHYGVDGKLVATARGKAWSETGLTLDIEPGVDGVRHTITQGEAASSRRLDAFFLGQEKVYTHEGEIFDGNGSVLEKVGGVWTTQGCRWSKRYRRMAAAGDVFTMFKLALHGYSGAADDERGAACVPERVPVDAARGRRLDVMLASAGGVHAPVPVWSFGESMPVRPAETTEEDEPAASSAVAEPAEEPAEEDATDEEPWPVADASPADMATYLARHMEWYMEWPHVDETFVAVYRSLPVPSDPYSY